jgi:hypothetical protein
MLVSCVEFENAENPVYVLGDFASGSRIFGGEIMRHFVESYSAALENLANLETTGSLFVKICSSTLGSEKVKKVARRTKSATARDKRCWNEKCTSVHNSSGSSCGKTHSLRSDFKQTI